MTGDSSKILHSAIWKRSMHNIIYSFAQEDRDVSDCTGNINSSVSCFQPSSQNWPCLSLEASCGWTPVPGVVPALSLTASGLCHSSNPCSAFFFSQTTVSTFTVGLLHAFAWEKAQTAFGQKKRVCLPALPLLQQTAYEHNPSMTLRRRQECRQGTAEDAGLVIWMLQYSACLITFLSQLFKILVHKLLV